MVSFPLPPLFLEIADGDSAAETSGGRYFRAANVKALEETYSEIDRLEKTQKEIPRYLEYDELFAWPAGAAILLVLLEIVLRGTVFRRIP